MAIGLPVLIGYGLAHPREDDLRTLLIGPGETALLVGIGVISDAPAQTAVLPSSDALTSSCPALSRDRMSPRSKSPMESGPLAPVKELRSWSF